MWRSDFSADGDAFVEIVDRHQAHRVHAHLEQAEAQPRTLREQLAPRVAYGVETDQTLAARMHAHDLFVFRPERHHGGEVGTLECAIEGGFGLLSWDFLAGNGTPADESIGRCAA